MTNDKVIDVQYRYMECLTFYFLKIIVWLHCSRKLSLKIIYWFEISSLDWWLCFALVSVTYKFSLNAS